MATRVKNPARETYSWETTVLRKKQTPTNSPFKTISLTASISTQTSTHTGSVLCFTARVRDAQSDADVQSVLYGSMVFQIQKKTLNILSLDPEKTPGVHIKLAAIAARFFDSHHCHSIHTQLDAGSALDLFRLGFIPQNPTQMLSVSGEEAPEYSQNIDIYDLVTRLRNDPEDARAKELLQKVEHNGLTLPQVAIDSWRSLGQHFPNIPLRTESTLCSIWLPHHPGEVFVYTSPTDSTQLIKTRSSREEVVYTLRRKGMNLAEVTYSVRESHLRITNVGLYRDQLSNNAEVLKILISLSIRAAFTNSHCKGVVKVTCGRSSTMAHALIQMGFKECGHVPDTNPSLIELSSEPEMASRIHLLFLISALQEELRLLIMGIHPKYKPKPFQNIASMFSQLLHISSIERTPEAHSKANNRILNLLREIDNLLLEYFPLQETNEEEVEPQGFLDLVSAQFDEIATKIPKIEDQGMLYCDMPKIVFIAVYLVTCELFKLSPGSSFSKQSERSLSLKTINRLYLMIEKVNFEEIYERHLGNKAPVIESLRVPNGKAKAAMPPPASLRNAPLPSPLRRVFTVSGGGRKSPVNHA